MDKHAGRMMVALADAVEAVEELTGIPRERLAVSATADGVLVGENIRGGIQVLVGHDGGMLMASSAAMPERMAAGYRTGWRTTSEEFAAFKAGRTQ